MKHRQLIVLFVLIFMFSGLCLSPALSGDVEDSGKVVGEALKEVTPLGLPDAWDVFIRGRKAKAVAQEAEDALRQAEDARDAAISLEDSEARSIAEQAIEIAKTALRRVRDDIQRIHGLNLILKRLREVFGAQISAEADAELKKRYGFYHAPVQTRSLSVMVEKLKKVSLRPGEKLNVRILDTSHLTTIAGATSTTVYYDRAYLDMKPSDNELMFVTAHELAHAELDHVVLWVVNNKLQLKLQDLEGLDRFNAKDPRVFTAIREAALKVVMGEYSREQEIQADVLGAKLALGAGASPAGIKETMDRLERLERKRMSKLNPPERKLDRLTADHPTPKERLSVLERVLGSRFWEKASH